MLMTKRLISGLLFLFLLLLGGQSFAFTHVKGGKRLSSSKFRHNDHDDMARVSLSGGDAEVDTSIGPTRSTTIGSERYGEDNFGDIMLKDQIGCETDISISSEFSSVERMVLTANGNLQRIMSAYYGSPIKVKVLKSEPILRENIKDRLVVTYDREVELLVNGRKFCNAVTEIQIFDREFEEIIKSKKVGIGQLYRYFGVLPSFALLNAGRKGANKEILWREYTLSCPQMRCQFIETFSPGFLDENFAITNT